MIHPSLQEFKRLARGHNLVPVYFECLADELTPMALLHSKYPKSPHCFLLESVEGGEHLGRYSFAAFNPVKVFRTHGERITLHDGHQQRSWTHPDPLSQLRDMLQGIHLAPLPGLPRFHGGAVGYISYDMVRSFERLPNRLQDDLGIPDSFFFLTQDIFIFDHVAHTLKIVRCVPTPPRANLSALYRRASADLRTLANDIKPPRFTPKTFAPLPPHSLGSSVTHRNEYKDAVRKAKEYIKAGDIIQTVLSRRISVPVKAHPVDIYRTLRMVNPSPYMYFLRDGDTHIIGTSPELLVRLENGIAETRPIAGTRPRGKTAEEDRRLEKQLLQDGKERAEHLMLVDLGRNDLGRVCVPGTVKVPEFMGIERYSHVMHMVSSVTGKLAANHDPFNLFRACFPAGTVTGAPKIRAMEIIEELETSRRGPYAGAVGYFSYSGNMDAAITIRTILLKGKTAHIQVGAGIVADSVPEREFLETQNKAAAMMTALRLAEMNPR